MKCRAQIADDPQCNERRKFTKARDGDNFLRRPQFNILFRIHKIFITVIILHSNNYKRTPHNLTFEHNYYIHDIGFLSYYIFEGFFFLVFAFTSLPFRAHRSQVWEKIRITNFSTVSAVRALKNVQGRRQENRERDRGGEK